MKLITKELDESVVRDNQNYIIYVVDDNSNPIEAKLCSWETIPPIVDEFVIKYNIILK